MLLFSFEGVRLCILKHKINEGSWNIGIINCSVQERPRNISLPVLFCLQQGDWSYVMPHVELTRID